MKTNMDRIKKDFDEITKITKTPNEGCTRFSFSKEDKKAREYFLKEMKNLGLEIKIDGIGNIRAKYIQNNKDKPSIMIGSHIDTVANGGRYDGLAGVVTALEVIRVIKEKNIKLNNPIELIIFSEEEGSNFGTTMLGSKFLSGYHKLEYLKELKNDDNISAYEFIKSFGLDIDNIENEILKKEEVKAMIELHIEQGGILDTENMSIGIVEGIVGMRTYRVKLYGVSNHAGTTPMYLRKDPMVGAAEIIIYMEKVAKEDAFDSTVATVGKINCKPNGSNIISSEIDFNVDIRDVKEKGIEIVSKELIKKVEEVSKKRGLKYSIELLGESEPVNLSKEVIETIEKIAKNKNYNYLKLNSGAVHDAAMLTHLTNVGMIFVPSIDGLSHCKEEDTKLEDIKLGADILLETVIDLAK